MSTNELDLDLDQGQSRGATRSRSSSRADSEESKPSKRLPIVLQDDMLKLYGNKLWHAANAEARAVITREPPVTVEGEPIDFKPIEGVEKAYNFLVYSYVDYVLLLKIMTDCLKQLLHPQKRLLFKRFIESTAGRVCELKMEMTNLYSTNIHNMVGVCTDLGLTPSDLEFKIPESMLQDQMQAVKKREEMLSLMLRKIQHIPECTVNDLLASASDHSSGKSGGYASIESDHLRSLGEGKKLNVTRKLSRKGSTSSGWSKTRSVASALSAVDAFSSKKKGTSTTSIASTVSDDTKKKPSEMEIQDFVTSRRYKEWLVDPEFHRKVKLLQHCCRVWLDRRAKEAIRHEQNIFCAMEKGPASSEKIRTADELYSKRQAMCESREQDFKARVESIRSEYLSGSEATFDRWALKVNIEQWIVELRDLLGKCPVYPEPDKGGCTALFTDKTVAEVEEEIELMDEKDQKKKPDDKKKKGKEGGKKDKDEGFKWVMPRSAILPDLVFALEEYVQYWNLKQEDDNEDQHMDLQLAREKIREEAEETIRLSVDAMIATELDRLRAVDREPPPKKEKEKNKNKKQKGGGKRGKKDPLGGLTTEELYTELVLAGIVQSPKQVTLDNLVGMANMDDTNQDVCRLATAPDLRMAIRETFGLPLCSGLIHSNVEHHKSLLLAGPSGTGKSLIAHGLCRETGSNLFNLSPTNLVGKYQGKKLENYLMSVLLKVAKEMEPTILLVDECHLLFPTKKSPKRPDVDRDKPARWAKMLTGLVKKLKPGDRILLVGLTQEPFFAKTKGMCTLFKDVLLVPFPEYGSRRTLWEHFLGQMDLARPHNVDFSVLAKLTEGYTGQDIRAILAKTCPIERQRRKVRLRNSEMIPAMASHFPKEEDFALEDWVEWFLTTPMMQTREELLEALAEEEEGGASGKKKK